jgi:hypothetical protein
MEFPKKPAAGDDVLEPMPDVESEPTLASGRKRMSYWELQDAIQFCRFVRLDGTESGVSKH